MDKKELTIRKIPCVLYGAPAKRVFVYVHGKCGCKEEAEAFAGNVTSRGYQVLAMDLPGHGHRKAEAERFVPWEVAPELGRIYDAIRESYKAVSLYAGSIGAYFSLLGFPEGAFRRVLLAAPVLDMERLICRMMEWASVTPKQLESEGEIPVDFGDPLSWRYYQYAREHPVSHSLGPTAVLYPQRDHLTERETAERFSNRFGARLTVMPDAGHFLHTQEQLAALQKWISDEAFREE